MSEISFIKSNSRQGYGATDTSSPMTGNNTPPRFRDTPISKALPTDPPFLSELKHLKALSSSSLDTHKIAEATFHAAERTAFFLSPAPTKTTREKWKSSYSITFAKKCEASFPEQIGFSPYAASKNACDIIIDTAAKYENPPASTDSINTASAIFKKKNIALHALNRALETYFSSAASEQSSLTATHQQKTSSTALPKAIKEAEQFMGNEWLHILAEIHPRT